MNKGTVNRNGIYRQYILLSKTYYMFRLTSKAIIMHRHEKIKEKEHLYEAGYYFFQPVTDDGFISKPKHVARSGK